MEHTTMIDGRGRELRIKRNELIRNSVFSYGFYDTAVSQYVYSKYFDESRGLNTSEVEKAKKIISSLRQIEDLEALIKYNDEHIERWIKEQDYEAIADNVLYYKVHDWSFVSEEYALSSIRDALMKIDTEALIKFRYKAKELHRIKDYWLIYEDERGDTIGTVDLFVGYIEKVLEERRINLIMTKKEVEEPKDMVNGYTPYLVVEGRFKWIAVSEDSDPEYIRERYKSFGVKDKDVLDFLVEHTKFKTVPIPSFVFKDELFE